MPMGCNGDGESVTPGARWEKTTGRRQQWVPDGRKRQTNDNDGHRVGKDWR